MEQFYNTDGSLNLYEVDKQKQIESKDGFDFK